MIAPQPVLSPTRAAGIPPISTVVDPGGMIGVGGCDCRRRKRADVERAHRGGRHAADEYGRHAGRSDGTRDDRSDRRLWRLEAYLFTSVDLDRAPVMTLGPLDATLTMVP